MLIAVCWVMGIQAAFGQLSPIHLPLLALAVSVVTPLLLNLNFLVAGLKQPADFLLNVTAMAAGDFLGCLIKIKLARFIIAPVLRLTGARPCP